MMSLALPRPPAGALLGSDAESRQATIAAEGAPVQIVYGRQVLGAQIFAVGTLGGDLVLGCVWCLGEIDAIESVLINGQVPAASVTITHYLGTATQGVDATLAAAITGYADTLTTVVAGQTVGLSYSALRIPALAASGFPRITAMIRGRKILDTRTGVTAYSTNPALVLRDFLASTVYGQGLTVEVAGTNSVADACDALLADGSRRREIGLVIDQPAPIPQWADTLRAYAGCFIAREGSTARLIPDRPAAVTRALTAADIAEGSLRTSRRSSRAAPTVVRVRYTDTSTAPWRDAEAVAKASGVDAGTVPRREQVVSLPGITRYAQAYREALERLNYLALTDLDAEWLTWDEGLKDQIGDIISLTHPIGLTAKQFRVTGVELDSPGRWRVTAAEYSASVYSDALAAPSWSDTSLPSPDYIAPPGALICASGTIHLLKLADGTIVSRMLVTWTPPANLYYARADVEYQKSGDGQWTRAPSVYDSAYCSPVEDGAVYSVRMRAVNSFGIASTWVTTSHVVVGKLEPPPPPTQFLISRDADGTRRLTWGEPVPRPVDLGGYRIKFILGTSGIWASMTQAHSGLLQSSPWETNQFAAGTYTFAIAAVDTTGNESSAVYIQATLADPRLAGALEVEVPHLAGWPGTKTNCWVDPSTGWLVGTDSKTWADLPIAGKTWGAWNTWAQASNQLTYTHTTINVGLIARFTPLVSAEYIGTAVLEVRTSSDAVTWTAWAVPSGQVSARYVEARAIVSGNGAALKMMTIILDAAVITEDINDLNTASLTGAYRLGVGDIRLPIAKAYGLIRGVGVSGQNVGPGFSWDLIDKNTSPGPRIKIYIAGVLADAIIDATIRGV